MLVLTTLQNICQLLIHVWRQANPATRNRTRDHLISASATVRCSTNWAIAGLTPTIESPQHTLNMLPDAQIYWHLPRAKSLSHFSACHPCGAMEILRRRLSHFCACHPCGAMEVLQGASNSHGWLRRTYGLKFWRWRGHLVLGTPAIVLGGLTWPRQPRTSQWQKPSCSHLGSITWTVWPSGLRRWLKAPFRKGVGSNPTAVIPTQQTDRCRWSQAWTFFPDTPPFFSCCFWMCLRNHHQAETMSGVAQWLACWAHNPKVPRSKPGSAMVWHDLLSCVFRSASVPHHKGLFWELNPGPLAPWARIMPLEQTASC